MVATSFLSFFTDSVLRGPTLGCMFICLAASLIGIVVVLQKQSLIGEALSHAAYPGIILGAMVAGMLSISYDNEFYLSLVALSGAVVTALLGVWAIKALVKYTRASPDAALCFVLSTFFGVGLTFASEIQFSFTSLYRQVISYLYGQAATMTDVHMIIYGGFALVVVIAIASFYKELQVITFDRTFAKSIEIPVKWIENLFFFLSLLLLSSAFALWVSS